MSLFIVKNNIRVRLELLNPAIAMPNSMRISE